MIFGNCSLYQAFAVQDHDDGTSSSLFTSGLESLFRCYSAAILIAVSVHQ